MKKIIRLLKNFFFFGPYENLDEGGWKLEAYTEVNIPKWGYLCLFRHADGREKACILRSCEESGHFRVNTEWAKIQLGLRKDKKALLP